MAGGNLGSSPLPGGDPGPRFGPEDAHPLIAEVLYVGAGLPGVLPGHRSGPGDGHRHLVEIPAPGQGPGGGFPGLVPGHGWRPRPCPLVEARTLFALSFF